MAPVRTNKKPVTIGVRWNCRMCGSNVAALNPIKLSEVAVANASKTVDPSAKKRQMEPDEFFGCSTVTKTMGGK